MQPKIKDWLEQSRMQRDILVRMHHALMCRYGWIPMEEFKNLPVPTLFNLLRLIKEDEEYEAKMISKMKAKRR